MAATRFSSGSGPGVRNLASRTITTFALPAVMLSGQTRIAHPSPERRRLPPSPSETPVDCSSCTSPACPACAAFRPAPAAIRPKACCRRRAPAPSERLPRLAPASKAVIRTRLRPLRKTTLSRTAAQHRPTARSCCRWPGIGVEDLLRAIRRLHRVHIDDGLQASLILVVRGR